MNILFDYMQQLIICRITLSKKSSCEQNISILVDFGVQFALRENKGKM